MFWVCIVVYNYALYRLCYLDNEIDGHQEHRHLIWMLEDPPPEVVRLVNLISATPDTIDPTQI